MKHIETEYPAIALLLLIAYADGKLCEKDEETIRSLAPNFGVGQQQINDLIAHFEKIADRGSKKVGIKPLEDGRRMIKGDVFIREAKHFIELLKEKKTDKTAVLMAATLLTEGSQGSVVSKKIKQNIMGLL